MTRRIVLATLAVFLVVSPAFAGVDIDPSDVQPRLFMKVTKVHHGHRVSTTRRAGRQVVTFNCYIFIAQPAGKCVPTKPKTPGRPDLTEGAIFQAVREIGLPSLTVRIQPGRSTLVNIPTIFYTDPEAFRRSITLLGYDIDLIASPIRYTWLHGDGTATTTSRPGRPYPSKDVTYRYRDPAKSVRPRVDVTYQVRYRVDGGAWATIGQTLVAAGPTANLEVKEAAPVLTTP